MTGFEAIKTTLKALYRNHFREEPGYYSPLPKSGSNRQYFRLKSENNKAIGVYNPNDEENKAFIYLTKHFHKQSLPVPALYASSPEGYTYLLEDLGDDSLYGYLPGDGVFPEKLLNLYKSALDALIGFQTRGIKNLDTSYCYPVASFNKRSMLWDLYYFKYYFLLPTGVIFHEKKLDDEFDRLLEYLQDNKDNYFMYRDFQSRNIFIKEDKLYFIDYQGGRKGPLQYDVVSLLYQAKANIPEETREHLLAYYMQKASESITLDKQKFREQYDGFVVLRILQTLGAYGLRGLIEKKSHFIESLPMALNNLLRLMDSGRPQLPYLREILHSVNRHAFSYEGFPESDILTVHIGSFSYRKGLPLDTTGHGGGFIFDCRSLPNPGREEKYKMVTGKDQAVVDYLSGSKEVWDYLNNVKKILDQSIDNYLHRGFKYMAVHFGCTGGQHRSVFCSEEIARHIMNKGGVKVVLKHRELEKDT